MRFAVKKCDYNKEYVISSFHKVRAAIKFIAHYDPDGTMPLIVFDNHLQEAVNWTAEAIRNTAAYLKQHNKALERKVAWQKEGF